MQFKLIFNEIVLKQLIKNCILILTIITIYKIEI